MNFFNAQRLTSNLVKINNHSASSSKVTSCSPESAAATKSNIQLNEPANKKLVCQVSQTRAMPFSTTSNFIDYNSFGPLKPMPEPIVSVFYCWI